MQHLLDQAGLAQQVLVDSAGTSGHHVGEAADERMRSHALERGLELTSRSRKLVAKDFQEFDYILVMDQSNFDDAAALVAEGPLRSKIHLFTDYCLSSRVSSVPDPYYGGQAGFERVLDIVEDAAKGLLAHLKTKM